MISEEMFNAFKNQYKKEHGIEITNSQALAICLHENAILCTQKFILELELEIGELDADKKWRITEDINSYCLSLIFVYLSSAHKLDDIGKLVLNEYIKFIKNISGATNEEQEKAITEFLLKKLNQNVEIWLSAPFEKDIIINKINSGISYAFPPTYDCKPNVEKLICNVELSMKHFRII